MVVSENRIVENLPFVTYDDIQGCRKSMFQSLMRSGLDFKYYMEGHDDSSKIMKFGNLVDTLLFEPDKLAERYISHPDTYPGKSGPSKWTWAAKYCKEWRDDLVGEDVEIVSQEDIDRARKIVENIKRHPEAQKWLSNATYQVSLFWVDPDTEVGCKGRPDMICGQIDHAIRIPDLKITNDPHPGAFSRIIYNLGYHAAAAFYHDGYFLAQGITPEGETPKIPMSFIAAQSDPPHDVVCYDLDDESFKIGRVVYKEALERYCNYTDNDEYPGYSNIIEEIGIPAYGKNKYFYEGQF